MVQMKKISTAMTPTIKRNRTNTPTMYPPSTLRTLMISRLFYSRFERYRRRQQLRKNGSCHSSPSVKPPISSLFALFMTMPFDGAQPSTCSSVHCISDELSICGLNPNQVWTTSVWTGPIPTGTDRFETESNRTDTIGPVRSICISRTDRFGPSQLFGPIGPVQMQARTEDRPIWTDMQIIHIKDGM